MADAAQRQSQPESQGASPRQLRKARKDARNLVRETRRVMKRAGKRLQKEPRAQLEGALEAVEQAEQGTDLGKLESAVKRLETVSDKQLSFARRNPSLEYALSIGKALLLALVLRMFVIEAFKIPSGSMIPTLLIGDHLFVNKLSYGVRLPVIDWMPLHWGGYERGEIIVFVNPLDDGLPLMQRRDYIKRIVGLPGDTVEVRDEVVYVNGVAQPRELAQEDFRYFERLGDDGPWVRASSDLWKETLIGADGEKVVHDVLRAPEIPHAKVQGPYKVPANHLFMMGDNRDNSADGRSEPGGWYVPFDHVKGRALFIWLSVGKPGWWMWGDGVGLRFERFFQGVH